MNNPYWQRAAFYEARARRYQRQAQLLLERDSDPDSAGILLYESAKQCINALANQQGTNPAATGEKMRFLFGVAEQETEYPNLVANWRVGAALHVHADRGHLTESKFMESWQAAQTFIDQMLLIYAHSG